MPQLKNIANASFKINGVGLTSTSNETVFDKIENSLIFAKTQTPTSGVIGTLVAFTLTLTNLSNTVAITDMVVTDNLAVAGYTYVTGTAKIDGVSVSGNPTSGITVGIIPANGTKVVTFSATVN